MLPVGPYILGYNASGFSDIMELQIWAETDENIL